MLEKFKLMFLNEENKEKYLLNKEKKKREEMRKKGSEPVEDNKQSKKSKKSKKADKSKKVDKVKKESKFKKSKVSTKEIDSKIDVKGKSRREIYVERKRMEKELEEEKKLEEMGREILVDEEGRPVKRKVVKKVVKRVVKKGEPVEGSSDVETVDKESVSRGSGLVEQVDSSKEAIDSIRGRLERIGKFTKGEDLPIEHKLHDIGEEEDEELTSEESVLKEEKINKIIEKENSQLAFARERELEEEERRKKELVLKKAEEKEKYLGIVIDLPPTSDVDRIVRMALDKGVPEWFLREEGLLVDDEDFDDEHVGEEVGEEVEGEVEEEGIVDVDVTDFNLPSTDNDLDKSDTITKEIQVEEDVPVAIDTSILARLENLKIKREVLKVDGDKILVKEEKEGKDGLTKSKYSNYKLSEEDIGKLAVGEDVSDDIALESHDEEIIIDGEIYDIDEADEKRIAKDYEKREVWLISEDYGLFVRSGAELEGSRYKVFMVADERDFLLATRNSENVLVITQQIPDVIKSSIVSYIKYLDSEKISARLVTLENSLVNSELIEKILIDLSVEELDSYYEEFSSKDYGKSKKSIVEVLKVISFDLTDGIDAEVDLSGKINFADNSEKENEIDFGSGEVELDLEDFGNDHIEVDLNFLVDRK